MTFVQKMHAQMLMKLTPARKMLVKSTSDEHWDDPRSI